MGGTGIKTDMGRIRTVRKERGIGTRRVRKGREEKVISIARSQKGRNRGRILERMNRRRLKNWIKFVMRSRGKDRKVRDLTGKSLKMMSKGSSQEKTLER